MLRGEACRQRDANPMNEGRAIPQMTAERAVDADGALPRALTPPRGFKWRGVGIRLVILLLVGALIVVVAREWDWWVGSAVDQTTDDAYLQADVTPLAAKIAGYVRRIPVRDFQKVKAGDLLVEIVDDDYRAQVAQAQGNVAAAEATIETIERQKLLQNAVIMQAEATIEASKADLTRYHLEAVRQQILLQKSLVGTPQIVEQATDNEKHAAATLALNEAQRDQQRQQLTVLASQEKTGARDACGATGGARSGDDQSWLYPHQRAGGRHGRAASGPGRPIRQRRRPGDLGRAAARCLGRRQLQGDPDDSYPRRTVGARDGRRISGTVLHGHVDGWSPASGAEFSLLPPDNATGNFTKVVQRTSRQDFA